MYCCVEQSSGELTGAQPSMALGIVIIGMVIGALIAAAALIAGHSLWIALAVYAGVGAGSVVLVALSVLLTSWASKCSTDTVMRALAEGG